ncbi:penicillin-binding protein 1C [Burkholderiaceae bacterium DAT-1]|nr:penicillin-binding protein 1C [Burkholderiaceae bacterium DAT-1]
MWFSKRGWQVSLLALTVSFAYPAHANVPGVAQVRAAYLPSDWVITDRNGMPLQTVRHDMQVRRLAWLTLDEVSPALQTALITAEDSRFWSHDGVDWAAMMKAAWSNLRGNNQAVRGASTLTMQLAGLLDPALQPGKGVRRTWGQKWDQALAARDIEKQWAKREILEAYLNLLPLRGETVGIRAASQTLFGKAPAGLNWTEAVILAALIRQPQASAETVADRACAIAAAIPEDSLGAVLRPECWQIKATVKLGLGGDSAMPRFQLNQAPHIARQVMAGWGERPAPAPRVPGGMPEIRTTLDARLQGVAEESLKAHLRALRHQNVQDGAVLVLDNRTGEVLVWIGSNADSSAAADVDGVLAARQAGSTLKPFLYALALEKRKLTAASLLHDSSLALTAANGAYIPQNYDRQFKGWVSARTALASSLNIPAVRTILLTGVDSFYARLKVLGFTTLDFPADHYGFGLALGDADVRLLDLTNAYRALANGGTASSLAPILFTTASNTTPTTRIKPAQAFSRESSFIVADMLSDRGARAPTFDLENTLATRVWSAVKTGTSKDMRDNWCIGFTSRYTIGVWVGNFSGEPMWNVSGMHGAAPVWHDMVHALHSETMHDVRPVAPAGLVSRKVDYPGGEEASHQEWFIRGTELSRIVRADAGGTEMLVSARPRIRYPADGLVIALDPDIPAASEGILLQADGEMTGMHWLLERKGDAPCRNKLHPGEVWSPQPGRWTVRLQDEQGREMDRAVHISVRGNARHPRACDL